MVKESLKLRLLLFENCNRNCKGCCNKQWNLKRLPVEGDFSDYKKIILTGGEPMLAPHFIIFVTNKIREVNNCPIYLYTAKVDKVVESLKVLDYIDGLTLTLHEPDDLLDFYILNSNLMYWDIRNGRFSKKSLRLNVFEGIEIDENAFPLWKVKKNIKWIEDCPLPKDEVFCRIKIGEELE